MSIFRSLLAIKVFREGQAEIAVRVQREALREAREAREAAEAELQRLLREGLDHERALYRDLCARLVRLREIEAVQMTVAALRQREAAQKDAVTTARQSQDLATERLDAARITHETATKQKSKFVDLSRNFADAQLRELERKEDLEMEEAAGAARDREDWDAHDSEVVA